ncbi:MAG: transglycosylase SLT domain-containing protein [Alistipes sp.]
MKQLLTLILLLTLTAPQAAPLDKRPPAATKATPKPAPTTTPPATIDPMTVIARSKGEVKKKEPAAQKPAEELTARMSGVQIDSLLSEWHERQTLDSFDNFFDNYVNINTQSNALSPNMLPDSVYERRLRDLASPVQLTYNSVVKAYIDRYTNTRYGTINRILSLSQYYFPLIEEELIKADLPVELRALPIIESALSPTVVSPMGATGLWQFMPTTGKVYGLEVNSLIDQRRDPMLATRAACRYLKDLYAIFKDWTLAIAAYNCGPGNVNKAIARAGGNCHSVWDIYDYLPRETRGYVPAFIGATYAYAYHRQHGIEFVQSPLPLATDTIRVNRMMHLGQIASTIDLPMKTLQQLNPQYKLDIIPATNKSYVLVLPQRYVTQYIEQQDSIFAKGSDFLKDYLNPANLSRQTSAQVQQRSKTSTPTRSTLYTVKRGDTLGEIARRYRVTTVQIMRWNNLKNAHALRTGQRLKIGGR